MKLWRVFMTIHEIRDGWSSANHLPTFYVHGVDAECARAQAMRVTRSGFPVTSGSVIAVDETLEPIESTYFAWSYQQPATVEVSP